MEYIVFRTLRMIEREIALYRDLYACVCNQQKLIMQSDMMDLLVVMVEQKELTSEITLVENEIMEELKDLAVLLGMDLPKNKELTINNVVNSLQECYGEFAEMIKTRCWVLTILLKKTKVQNDENMDSLRNCLELWGNQPLVFDFWNKLGENWKHEMADDLLAYNQEFFESEFVLENIYPNYTTV